MIIKNGKCQDCNRFFYNTKDTKRKYCYECLTKHDNDNVDRLTSKKYGINSATKIGALSELVASIDLIRKGYDVFRALSASCPCDLIIIKDGLLKRVEVRTASMRRGQLSYSDGDIEEGKSDILALVLDDDVLYALPKKGEITLLTL
jgi:hypothetical protein